jgi:hypothetical protein
LQLGPIPQSLGYFAAVERPKITFHMGLFGLPKMTQFGRKTAKIFFGRIVTVVFFSPRVEKPDKNSS